MAVKKCCIVNCHSCSTRKEDIGVTYHKYPKDVSLRDTWLSVTRHKHSNIATTSYVCSRHFCKSDFQVYKDSKYVLKSGAVPSIFSWNIKTQKMDSFVTSSESNEDEKNLSMSYKESESENLDAIKKFIEDQEKEILDQKYDKNDTDVEEKNELKTNKVESNIEECGKMEEPLAVATSVMDLILNETESKMFSKKDDRSFDKQCHSPGEKGNIMPLTVGSKVEAKDFGEFWHPAKIVEVDYDEMEVLVHYDNYIKKHDEWINVSSPRLRPLNNMPNGPPSEVTNTETVKMETNIVKEDDKQDEKQKLKFVVGERCLARWRDNRRFMATINKDLGSGSYEIIFDDGFQWKCTTSRMYKLKESERLDPLMIDTSSSSSTSANPSPIPYGSGPSNLSPGLNISQTPVFHTHLFDPTRDYLGSKSERREKKRKLNIKEIFNIGQKKRKKQRSPKETNISITRIIKQRKPWNVRKKIKVVLDVENKQDLKTDVPDAVASIIGTVAKENELKKEIISKSEAAPSESDVQSKVDEDNNIPKRNDDDENSGSIKEVSFSDIKSSIDLVLEEETKLENFEATDDRKHEEVIGRIKEVIIKLEDGLNRAERLDSPMRKESPEEDNKLNTKEPAVVDPPLVSNEDKQSSIAQSESIKIKTNEGKVKKSISKLKKSKKLRLLQEKKVKKQVEKVKSELEEMKLQVEEMKKQMLKTEVLTSPSHTTVMPESFLLPGEWCCKWVNGQPEGTVSEIESEMKIDSSGKPSLPRRSVQVEDKRLPEGWTKHMVRRSLGSSAGKWDVVLISPDNRRFHTKTDMRSFLENEASVDLKEYENTLLDFGTHLKLSRRMGWITNTNVEESVIALPAVIMNSSSPLIRRKKLGLKKVKRIMKASVEKRRRWGGVGSKIRRIVVHANDELPGTSSDTFYDLPDELANADSANEDGYVFVGSLKVQVIDNLLRCPAEGCVKNFRNNTLLKMHIKHYHRELRKLYGVTPKVLDMAYARTRPTKAKIIKMRNETGPKIIKVKVPRPPKRNEDQKIDIQDLESELQVDIPLTKDENIVPKIDESPKLRNVLTSKPVKRPKVLLPVRRLEKDLNEGIKELEQEIRMNTPGNIPTVEVLDFETAISTHTVTRPLESKKKATKGFATFAKKPMSEDEEWLAMNSDVETMSSFPGSGTPDSRQTVDNKTSINLAVSSESNDDQKEAIYTYTETGERIKIVQMKREEIINCHCGYREEDGLMVQCELCLCWQHALCHNIQKESEVPEKYTCSICLNPRRGRRSKRFVHDQDRMYEGLLAGARPCDALRRSHELAGNLLRVQDALHALRVKYYVATKKDHPKLYLWAKDWESSELSVTQEKLNSGYSDLNIIINNIGKENLPLKTDDIKDMQMDVRLSAAEENDERFSQRDVPLGSQTLLSGLLSSPGGTTLELPICTSELERLAKSVQDQGPCVKAPQPEAAIENGACRERLLLHIQRCQALVDARLDSIEAQVAELESQDPSFEDDETADFYPRTKQTIQMLMRDLDTMEELGVIT